MHHSRLISTCLFILLLTNTLVAKNKEKFLPLHSEIYPLEKYKDEARKINKLKIWDGKLYIGYGDYGVNTGPTDILSWDLSTHNLKTEFTVDDEAIVRFKEVNDQLMIPGVDATEDWNYGNLYIKDHDQWKKYRTIPKGLHVFDVVRYKDQLYTSIGSVCDFNDKNQTAMGAVFSSADSAKTWNISYMTGADNFKVSRVDELIELKGKLFAFVHSFYQTSKSDLPNNYQNAIPGNPNRIVSVLSSNPLGHDDLLCFDGQKWIESDIIPEPNIALIKPYQWQNQVLLECFQSEYLYATDASLPLVNVHYYLFDGEQVKKIKLPFSKIIDVVNDDQDLLILAKKQNHNVIAKISQNLKIDEYQLPDKVQPSAIEIYREMIFIGASDANVYTTQLSKASNEPISDFPLSYTCQSLMPAKDNKYQIFIKQRDMLHLPVAYSVNNQTDYSILSLKNIKECIFFTEKKIKSITINQKQFDISSFNSYFLNISLSEDHIIVTDANLTSGSLTYQSTVIDSLAYKINKDQPSLNLFMLKSWLDYTPSDFTFNFNASFASDLKAGILSIDDIYHLNYPNKIIQVKMNRKLWQKILEEKADLIKKCIFLSQDSEALLNTPINPEKEEWTMLLNDYVFEKILLPYQSSFEYKNLEILSAQLMILYFQKGHKLSE